MPPSPQTTKLTSTLHLLIPRLRLLQKKDTASSVIQRRDLSALLAEGRASSARIRVENVIATDTAVEAMEMVELYCELLLARANVLDQAAFGERGVQARNRARVASVAAAGGKQSVHAVGDSSGASGSGGGGGGRFAFFGLGAKHTPKPSATSTNETAEQPPTTGEDTAAQEEYIDPALDEAAAVIFYAYPRFPHDVRELTVLRNLLGERWGKEFMALAQEDAVPGVRVPARVAKALRVRAPSPELVDCYLREIARAYGVNWGDYGHLVEGEAPTTAGLDVDVSSGTSGTSGDGLGDGGGGGDIPSTPTRRSPTENEARRASETLALNQATPPRGLHTQTQTKSPVSVAPPGPRLDNLHPRVKVPGDSFSTLSSAAGGETAQKKSEIPELDELTRRFAALRR